MPDELSRPPFPSEPKMGIQPVSMVERSPTGLAVLPQVVVKVVTVLVGLAAIGIPIFTTMLPAPWAATGLMVCSSIVGIGTVFGIASPGVRKEAGAQPVTIAAPRIGPPQP